jgi:hypothetical protein
VKITWFATSHVIQYLSLCVSLLVEIFLHCCQFLKIACYYIPDFYFNLTYETVPWFSHSKSSVAQISNLNVIFEFILLRDNVYSLGLPHNHLDKSDIQ